MAEILGIRIPRNPAIYKKNIHIHIICIHTQLLKEILLDMKYDDKAKKELVEFCREQFQNNPHELEIINEFEQTYHTHTPIWWYTRECFTYQLLNRALRIQDIQVILKMGFFLRDVHRHLEELYSKLDQNKIITVYRGKTMSNAEFDEIKNKQDGGLLAFNTFLSTSINEDLKQLTEYIRQQLSDFTKWERLGQLLIIMGNFDKAEEIFKILLQETFKDNEKIQSSLFYQLGNIKNKKGDYIEALKFDKNMSI